MVKRIVSLAPALIGAASCVVLAATQSSVLQLITDKKLEVHGLYEAVFGWGSVQTAFLFGVYALILTKNDGFIGAIKDTRGLKSFYGYLKAAIYAGFIITIVTMPLLGYPEPPDHFGMFYLILCAWVGLFAFAFATFIRVAYFFSVVIAVPDSKRVVAH